MNAPGLLQRVAAWLGLSWPYVPRGVFEMAIRENAYLREQVAEARADLRELLRQPTGAPGVSGPPPARPPRPIRMTAETLSGLVEAREREKAKSAALVKEAFDVR